MGNPVSVESQYCLVPGYHVWYFQSHTCPHSCIGAFLTSPELPVSSATTFLPPTLPQAPGPVTTLTSIAPDSWAYLMSQPWITSPTIHMCTSAALCPTYKHPSTGSVILQSCPKDPSSASMPDRDVCECANTLFPCLVLVPLAPIDQWCLRAGAIFIYLSLSRIKTMLHTQPQCQPLDGADSIKWDCHED